MKYNVVYHAGATMGLRTKVSTGVLTLAAGNLVIEGKLPVSIPIEKIQSAELFRPQGIGTWIKLIHDDGTLFTAVPRFTLFGFFTLINMLQTKQLHAALEGATAARLRA